MKAWEMLPCPFCGKVPPEGKMQCVVWKGGESRFECGYCGALGPFPEDTPDYPSGAPERLTDHEASIRDREAVRAWNRRAAATVKSKPIAGV